MKRILLAASLLILTACQPPHGTGTGNPFQNGASSPASQTASGQIFFYACKTLEKCNAGMTDESCGNGLRDVTGFGSKLGLQDDSLTAVEIMMQEAQTRIAPDFVQANKCIAQMLKLNCDDPKVQQAYDPASAQAFAKTPEILDPVCTGVYSH